MQAGLTKEQLEEGWRVEGHKYLGITMMREFGKSGLVEGLTTTCCFGPSNFLC